MGTQLSQRQMRGGASFAHLQAQLEDIKTRTGHFKGYVNTESELVSLTPAIDDQVFIRDTNKWMRWDGTIWSAISSAASGGSSGGNAGPTNVSGSAIDVTMALNLLYNEMQDAEDNKRPQYRKHNMVIDSFTSLSGIDINESTYCEILNSELIMQRDFVMPKMTSPTTPAPYVLQASSSNSDVWKLADGDEGTYMAYSPSAGTLTFDAGSPVLMNSFRMVANNATYGPRNMNFYGSNDNTNWDLLIVRDGYTSNSNWSPATQTFSIPTHLMKEYQYYKLEFTNGYTAGIRINELTFIPELNPNGVGVAVSKLETVGAQPNKIILAANYTGSPVFDISLNNGVTWLENVKLNTLIDFGARQGVDLRLRIKVKAGDSINSLGYMWYDAKSLVSTAASDPALMDILLNDAVNLVTTNFRAAEDRNIGKYTWRAMVIDSFKDNSNVDTSISTNVSVNNGQLEITDPLQGNGTLITLPEIATESPSKFVVVSEHTGVVQYDVSLNNGASWIANVKPETFIDVSSQQGTQLRVHAVLSPGASIQSLGYVWFKNETQGLGAIITNIGTSDVMKRLEKLEEISTNYFEYVEEPFDNPARFDETASDVILEKGRIRAGTRAIFEDSFENASYMDVNNSAGAIIENGAVKVPPTGVPTGQFVSSTLPIPSTSTINLDAGVTNNSLQVFHNLKDISQGWSFGGDTVTSVKTVVDRTGRLWEFALGIENIFYRIRTVSGVIFMSSIAALGAAGVNYISRVNFVIDVDHDNRVWLLHRSAGNYLLTGLNADGSIYRTTVISSHGSQTNMQANSGALGIAISNDNTVWCLTGYSNSRYLTGVRASDGILEYPYTMLANLSSLHGANVRYDELNHRLEMVLFANSSNSHQLILFDIATRTVQTVSLSSIMNSAALNSYETHFAIRRGSFMYVGYVIASSSSLRLHKINASTYQLVASASIGNVGASGTLSNQVSPIWLGNYLHVGYPSTDSANRPMSMVFDENLNIIADAQPIIETPGGVCYGLNLYINPFTNELRAQSVIGTTLSEVEFTPNTSKAVFEVTPDGGMTWQRATLGNDITFATPSTDIRVKIKLDTLNANDRVSSEVSWYRLRNVENTRTEFVSTYVSKALTKGSPIHHATISEDVALNNGTIEWELSNDNGVTWESVQVGQRHVFTTTGTGILKAKATLITPANEVYGPTIEGYSVTAGRVVMQQDIQTLQVNMLKTNFKLASMMNATRYAMKDMIVDTFTDASGVGPNSTITHDSQNKSVYSGGVLTPETTIPLMTSDTTPEGIASASFSRSGDAYAPFRAFDRGAVSTNWYTYGTTIGTGHWIQYEYPTARRVTKISITPFRISSGSDSIGDFQFQASNDGMNFTTLYTGVAARNLNKQYFEFSNPVKYKMYRVFITSSPQGSYVGLAELEMFELVENTTDAYLYSLTEALLSDPTHFLLSVDITGNESELSFEVSKDNGLTWRTCYPDIEASLAGLPSTNELLVRAIFAPLSSAHINVWSYSWR